MGINSIGSVAASIARIGGNPRTHVATMRTRYEGSFLVARALLYQKSNSCF